MKFVKKTISLPEEVFHYAKSRAQKRSKEEARQVGVSNVISDLLVAAKRREEQRAA